MKFVSNFLATLLFTQSLIAAPLIVLSGEPSEIQRAAINELLKKQYPSLESFTSREPENKDCTLREKSLLQLCFKEEKILIIRSEREKLRKTVRRLMMLEDQTEKPFQKEGPL